MTYHYGKKFAKSVFYMDTESREYACIKNELFDFENQMSLQIGDELYSVRWIDCAITKYSNILNGEPVAK